MKFTKALLFIILFFLSNQTFSQITLANKVFESGSKTHFGNPKKCEFYFECDCCSGKILFTNSHSFIMIDYCASDFVLSKGVYSIKNGAVILKSDGLQTEVSYNWEQETNPKATPAFFIKTSSVKKFLVNFKIDTCERLLLVDETTENPFAAIETDISLEDEIKALKNYKLEKHINLIWNYH